MAAIDHQTCTVYLNAAVVPRVAAVEGKDGNGTVHNARHFLTVEIADDVVTSAQHVWLHVPDEEHQSPKIVKIEPLLHAEMPAEQFAGRHMTILRSVYHAHTQTWSEAVPSQHETASVDTL